MTEIPKISVAVDAATTAIASTVKKTVDPVSIYTVKKGDSLSKIVAQEYGIDISTKEGKAKAHDLALKVAQQDDNSFIQKQTAEKKFHYKPTRSYNKKAPNLDLLKEGQKIKLGKIGDLKPKGYVEPKVESPVVSSGTEPDVPKTPATPSEDPAKKLGVPAGVTLVDAAKKAEEEAAAVPTAKPESSSKTPLTYDPDKSSKALLKGGDKEVEIPQWKEPKTPSEVISDFKDGIQPRPFVDGMAPKDAPGGDLAAQRLKKALEESPDGKPFYVDESILGLDKK